MEDGRGIAQSQIESEHSSNSSFIGEGWLEGNENFSKENGLLFTKSEGKGGVISAFSFFPPTKGKFKIVKTNVSVGNKQFSV